MCYMHREHSHLLFDLEITWQRNNMLSSHQSYRLGDNIKYGGNWTNLTWQLAKFCEPAKVRMLYANYEHKSPNEEKFREYGLLEALSVKYSLKTGIKRRERL